MRRIVPMLGIDSGSNEGYNRLLPGPVLSLSFVGKSAR